MAGFGLLCTIGEPAYAHIPHDGNHQQVQFADGCARSRERLLVGSNELLASGDGDGRLDSAYRVHIPVPAEVLRPRNHAWLCQRMKACIDIKAFALNIQINNIGGVVLTKTKGYKVLVAALAFVLVLMLLSACSEDNNSGSNTNQGAEKNNASSVGNTAEELTLFIDAPWYPVKEWKGPITEKITEKTGIKLKVTVATDDKQLPLMIASGDLPDLVFTYGNVSRLSDSKLSYPWNELIEKYAPDFKIDKTRIAIHTMDDGNFYTIRNAFATQEEWAANKYALGNNGNPGIAVREDILKQLGNPPIKTLDDFVNVLGMVKDKYPDMVPLIMDKEWIEQYFLMQFGVDATFGSPWFEQGGKVDFFIRHQKMKDYFKFMNKLYRSGYIMAENFAHANDKIDDQYATSGRAFAHMYTVSVADSDNAVVKREGAPSHSRCCRPLCRVMRKLSAEGLASQVRSLRRKIKILRSRSNCCSTWQPTKVRSSRCSE